MNILIPDSWLREYLETDASPKQIKDYLSLCGPSIEKVTKTNDDYIYHIEITSNRIDMAGVYGIAREAAAILPRFGVKSRLKELKIADPPACSNNIPLKIEDPQKLCERLLAFTMQNVANAPSPDFIRDRLEKSGVRSLNNIIDITNYVMLELGHPCHVFDYDRIKTGKLLIRKAKKGEILVTLDGKRCILEENDVIIDDGTERIIDLPGIMGTQNSVVTPQTKRIVVFIESNNPLYIRRTSMRLALRTLAATINEKHPDPELSKTTILRAIELYQKIARTKPVGNLIDIYPKPIKASSITVTDDFINERLGIKISLSEIKEILLSLHFEVQAKNSKELIATPPSFRQFDVTIAEDIVEEVARIYGYHNLPSKLMSGDIPTTNKPKDIPIENKIKLMLKYLGYTEIYSYSFISEKLIEKTNGDKNYPLKIANPLTEETKYMRATLIPSLLEVIVKNQAFRNHLNLFELAKVYIPRKNNLPEEISMLSIATEKGFYYLKGLVEQILEELGIGNYQLSTKIYPLYHPKQSINFAKNDLLLATVGKIHPEIALNFNIKKDLFIAEINIDRIISSSSPLKQYKPVPLYPEVIEDLSLNYPPKTTIGPVIEKIKKTTDLIKKVEVVDRFEKSITLRITYQDSQKNLTSEDVKSIRQKILNHLKTDFKIFLKQ